VSLTIRAAQPSDCAVILALVRELADYQQMQTEVEATADGIASALFAPAPRVFCDIAEWNGEAAGFAVWFLHYSTFRGRFGVYLEDLFVRPAWRRRGIGTAFMQRLARRCVADELARFEWSVMDSNAPSLEFYRSIGAEVQDQWKLCRLSGAALQTFAREGATP